jgi:hypothetical protein
LHHGEHEEHEGYIFVYEIMVKEESRCRVNSPSRAAITIELIR